MSAFAIVDDVSFFAANRSTTPTSDILDGINELSESTPQVLENLNPSATVARKSLVETKPSGNLSPFGWLISTIDSRQMLPERWPGIGTSELSAWRDTLQTTAVDHLQLLDNASVLTSSDLDTSKLKFETFANQAWHKSWGFFGMVDAVKKLADFPENWNGSGGVPLTQDNFEKSIDLMYLLSEQGVHSPYLYPSPRGGLIAEVGSRNSRITVVIDSEFGLLHIAGEQEQYEFDFANNEGFVQLLNQLEHLLAR